MPTPTADLRLLERERELERLDDLLEQARAGAGRLVLLEGAAGIGKSELLRELRGRAQRVGLTVLSARAGELERDYPFGLVRQLYAPALRSGDPETLLSGAARRAEGLLLGTDTNERLSLDVSFQLFHALYWLTVNLTEAGPVLLCLDDAHWSDAPSLEFCAYLVRRLEELPLLVAVGVRTGEAPEEPAGMGQLRTDMLAESIRPRALSEHAVAQLVRAELGADTGDDLCEACHEMSAGNPFMIRELLRELAATPEEIGVQHVRELAPRAVSHAVLVRLARLGEAPQSLANAVAVLGDEVDAHTAAALAQLDADAAARARDALAQAEILRAEGNLSFAHPLTRAAIYGDLPSGSRAELHGRAVNLLLDVRAASERVALHLLATDPTGDARAVAILRDAAARTMRHGRAETAVRLLRRALAEPPPASERPALLGELFKAEALAGDLAALDRFGELLEGDDPVPVEVVDFAPTAARGMFAIGEHARAVDFLSNSADRLRAADPETALRLDAELVAMAVRFPETVPLARERLERHVAAVEQPATPAERLMAANLAFDRAMRGVDARATTAIAERALAGGQMLADETSDSQPLYAAIEALLIADCQRVAAGPIDEALDDARRRGSAIALALASIEQSMAAQMRGDLRVAAAAARTTLTVAREGGWAQAVSNLLGLLVESLVEQDELSAARDELAAAGIGELIPLGQRGASRLLAARARLRFATGDVAGGAQDLVSAARAFELAGYELDYECWGALAVAALPGGGDRERVALTLERAEAFGAPRPLGIALRASALAADGADAMDQLRRSAEVLSESPARLELARTLVALGAALRRSRRRKEAREMLYEGVRIAESCNAARVAGRAREELAATGERVPARPITGADALTPSERRVAQMAAEGMSNKEIAQALFLTRKTIEFHLSNAYRKLDIASRAQLAQALDEG